MYFHQPLFQSFTPPIVYYYCPTTLIYYHQHNIPLTANTHTSNSYHFVHKQPSKAKAFQNFENPAEIIKQKMQTCESLSQLQIRHKSSLKPQMRAPTSNFSIPAVKPKEVKLSYRIQWRNENRNIVPNLINQMISFLLKPSKSKKVTHRLFDRLPQPQQCSQLKYFQYVKKIKQSVSHYVNQSVFLHFFEIHQPNCQLYSLEEQQFYMKICRIVILSFLRNEITLISLTSKRMSQAKRKVHLIARQALENKFLELCRAAK